MSRDLFLRKVFTQDGINVAVDIDCEKKTVTLVERTGSGAYHPKQWLFESRTREYLGSWVKILKAMEFAITEADKLLQEVEKRDEEKFVEMLMHLSDPKLKPEPPQSNK